MNFVSPATDKLFNPETIPIECQVPFPSFSECCADRPGIKKIILMRKRRRNEEAGVFGILFGVGMGRGGFRAGADDYHF
jgi:hypothetical protein